MMMTMTIILLINIIMKWSWTKGHQGPWRKSWSSALKTRASGQEFTWLCLYVPPIHLSPWSSPGVCWWQHHPFEERKVRTWVFASYSARGMTLKSAAILKKSFYSSSLTAANSSCCSSKQACSALCVHFLRWFSHFSTKDSNPSERGASYSSPLGEWRWGNNNYNNSITIASPY